MIFAALGIPGLFSAPEARLAPAVSAVRVSPTVKAVNSALPWVVNIGTQELTRVNDPFDLFFNQFSIALSASETSVEILPLGSGVIVDLPA